MDKIHSAQSVFTLGSYLPRDVSWIQNEAMLASNLFQIQNIVVAPALISFWTLPGRWHLRDVCLAPCVVFASPVSPFASVCTEDAKTYVPVENSNEETRYLGSLQIKPQGNSWICLKSMMDSRERSTTTIFAPGIVGSVCMSCWYTLKLTTTVQRLWLYRWMDWNHPSGCNGLKVYGWTGVI